MDFGTHVATGFLLSTAFDDPTAKLVCIVASVAPDIAMIPGYVFLYKQRKAIQEAGYIFAHIDYPLPKKIIGFYQLTHSFLPIMLLGLSGFFIWHHIVLAWCLGHVSHILWDIPTHRGQFACRPFYPLSAKKLEGFGDWWQTWSGVATVVICWFVLGGSLYYMFS